MKNHGLPSYDLLEEISKSYFDKNSTEEEITNNLESAAKKLQVTLTQDFRTIFGKTFIIKNHIIYFNDPSYRQSATGIYYIVSPENDADYIISIECLIDYSGIYIKSKNEPSAKTSNGIAKKIKEKINNESECHAELRNLKIKIPTFYQFLKKLRR